MGVSGNPFGVIRRALEKTARDRIEVHRAVAKAVRALIADQFAYGIDPYGRTQPAKANGRPAFFSEKLPRAIKLTPTAEGVAGIGELRENKHGDPRRQWLNAHQKGYEFPARESHGYRTARDSKGKLISVTKLKGMAAASTRTTTKSEWFGLKKTTRTRTLAEAHRVVVGQREAFWREAKTRARLVGRLTNVRAHTVHERVLIARLIYPEGQMGERWRNDVRAAVASTVQKQLDRGVKGK
jgi:hypothetical protein